MSEIVQIIAEKRAQKIDRLEAERDRLQAQRDALLAAAKQTVAYMDTTKKYPYGDSDCFIALRRAIAAAESNQQAA